MISHSKMLDGSFLSHASPIAANRRPVFLSPDSSQKPMWGMALIPRHRRMSVAEVSAAVRFKRNVGLWTQSGCREESLSSIEVEA